MNWIIVSKHGRVNRIESLDDSLPVLFRNGRLSIFVGSYYSVRRNGYRQVVSKKLGIA
jgi:hypothetical protein